MIEKGFLFDLNGTMIDDMEYHIRAWHHVLNNDLGAALSWQEVKKEMYGKNEELLVRVFGNDRFTKEEMRHLSIEKEKRYQKEFRPHLQLINGLENFLRLAHQKGLKMAIGTAAISFNVDFVLDNLNIRHYFSCIINADNVNRSKPDPETFLRAAEALQLMPDECIVFEDAPKGVEAAANACMKAVVLTTMHTSNEFAAYTNIGRFVQDYTDPWLMNLVEK